MRATMHNGRVGADGKAFSAKHDDRNFDMKKSKERGYGEHFHEEKTAENLTWHCYQLKHPGLSFDEAEHRFYLQHFGEHLHVQNDKYHASGHDERIKSIDDYRKAKQSCPEEVLFYLGSEKEHADVSTLRKVIGEQLMWEQKNFPQVKYLDYALHMDEATPHLHARRVWMSKDADGHEVVSQNKALADMGIQKPHPEKETTRWNNAKITYTQACREHLLELCKEHGLDIETEPKEKSKSGLTQIEYKAQQAEERAQKAEERAAKLEARNSTLERENAVLRAEKGIVDKTKVAEAEEEAKVSFTGKKVTMPVEEYEKMRTTANYVKTSRKESRKAIEDATKKLEEAKRIQEQRDTIIQNAQRDASAILADAKEKADEERKKYEAQHDLLLSEKAERDQLKDELEPLREERQHYQQIAELLTAETSKTYFKELSDVSAKYKHLNAGELVAFTDKGIKRIPAYGTDSMGRQKVSLRDIESAYGTDKLGVIADEPHKDIPLHVLTEIKQKLDANNISLSKDARIELQKAVTLQRSARSADELIR